MLSARTRPRTRFASAARPGALRTVMTKFVLIIPTVSAMSNLELSAEHPTLAAGAGPRLWKIWAATKLSSVPWGGERTTICRSVTEGSATAHSKVLVHTSSRNYASLALLGSSKKDSGLSHGSQCSFQARQPLPEAIPRNNGQV